MVDYDFDQEKHEHVGIRSSHASDLSNRSPTFRKCLAEDGLKQLSTLNKKLSMPGIAGVISHSSAEQRSSCLRSMLASMQHEEFYSSDTYCIPELGIYAGSIAHKDSVAASQIVFNEDRNIALIFSGEFFVDPDVRTSLRQRGHIVHSSNADCLVHLYEEHGEQFVEKLNGLFSGLLIDKTEGKAFLFNDRYSMERIYWHGTGDAFYFASEAKALLAILPQVRAFDEKGVAQFLSFGCTLDSRTLFRGVELLPGASIWLFERGACRKRKYFSPGTWESQPSLSTETFQSQFQETFARVLPRYFESPAKIGISLTGGLDTRMIMACRPDITGNVVCYTFSGETGQTFDDRLAAQVARVCGFEHRLLRIGSNFFSDFASHVDRTVYVTDGCFGATGAHEIYFNQQARQLAPIRLTGNYGSEVLRGASTFKPLKLSPGLFNAEFNCGLHSTAGSLTNGSVHPITFAAFREIPSNLFGGLAASRSQIGFRTPYLDNEIVALAYRAPESLRNSPLPAWRLIKANSPSLSSIPTDRRPSPDTPQPAAALKRLFSEATFKLDYLNNEGWPNWLSPFDSVFTRVTSSLKIVGLHKYLHYRRWFRRELADYLKDVVSNARTQQSPFWNRGFLEKMANDHVEGRRNYVSEINAVLTLEAVERLLLQGARSGEEELNRLDAPVIHPVFAEVV
jgi:asparagine synthase (glutamine-hydrolysing)